MREMSESDRGVAVAGVAFLEVNLGFLIKAHFESSIQNSAIGRRTAEARLKRVHGLYNRIRLAHELGLISCAKQEQLERIRAIRNQFAHDINVASFGHEKIIALCDGIPGWETPLSEMSEEIRGGAASQRYTSTVVTLHHWMDTEINNRKEQMKDKSDNR